MSASMLRWAAPPAAPPAVDEPAASSAGSATSRLHSGQLQSRWSLRAHSGKEGVVMVEVVVVG